jgi:Methyltransferase domain
MFYNPRLDDDDLRRLYSNYRSEDYQKMRHASEPWYTSKFNIGLASESAYKVRREKLAPILREHIGHRKIRRILDFGGDRGDLVMGLFDGAEAFVYDISGIAAAEGVTATKDPASCNADLVINSNVLEHVGFPRLVVNETLQATPKGGLVFLEVPYEAPFEPSRIARRIAQIGVMALTRPGLARHIMRPSALYMMHEHVNYYTEQTLATLMRSCGAKVIGSGRYSLSMPSKTGVVWCLGEKL